MLYLNKLKKYSASDGYVASKDWTGLASVRYVYSKVGWIGFSV